MSRRGFLTVHSIWEAQRGGTCPRLRRTKKTTGREGRGSSLAVRRGIGAAIAKLPGRGRPASPSPTPGRTDAASSLVKEIERGGGKAIAILADAGDARGSQRPPSRGR